MPSSSTPSPDDEHSTRHVLEGRELIDYLVEKASRVTNTELVLREDRRNRRVAIVFSVITFVGVSGLVGIARLYIDQAVSARTKEFREEMARNADRLELRIAGMHDEAQSLQRLLNDQIDSFTQSMQRRVEHLVAEQATEGLKELKQREQFISLVQLCDDIKEEVAKESFPENLLTTAVEITTQLAGSPDIVRELRFQHALETLVDILVRGDRVKDVNRVEEATREVCIKSRKIALNLTDHYGQLICGSPYPVEQLESEFERLTRYARASRELKYPEKALLWELFVEFKRNGYQRSSVTDEIVWMVFSLNDTDLRTFSYHMFFNSHPLHWMHEPDHKGRMIAKIVMDVLAAYPQLRGTVEEYIASPALQPSIEQLVTSKNERLARLQPELAEESESEEPNAQSDIPQMAAEQELENVLRR